MVVEVVGIRILHLANLQWSATYGIHAGVRANSELDFVGNKEKPTVIYFLCDHEVKS